jgi:hypothetical protein
MGDGFHQHPPEPRDTESQNQRQLFSINVCAAAPTRTDDGEFDGGVVDTGAKNSVMGLVQARRYCRLLGVPFRLAPTSNVFRFGTHVHRSMGRLAVLVPLPMSYYAATAIDVVDSDVPLIIGLDYLDGTQMYDDNVDDLLVHKPTSQSLPLLKNNGRLYFQWPRSILYNKQELLRAHAALYHPSHERLFN